MTAGLITFVSFTSCSKDDNNLNNSNKDLASLSNSAEVGAASLAVSKTITPQVMAFAQHMLMDHSMAQDLKNLGSNVGYG